MASCAVATGGDLRVALTTNPMMAQDWSFLAAVRPTWMARAPSSTYRWSDSYAITLLGPCKLHVLSPCQLPSALPRTFPALAGQTSRAPHGLISSCLSCPSWAWSRSGGERVPPRYPG
jgi:hypothetical protein